MKNKSTLDYFLNSPYYSIKHTNYFEIYDKLLSKFVGTKLTFVEIGVLDGGSLFMWRSYFGENARIIGVDMNPDATKWRAHGFEIYIGDQSSPNFWKSFFEKIGGVHVILDDGGHRNDQQISTIESALPFVVDGGMLIVEDTQTSFMKFESFKKYSFIKFLQEKVSSMYARSDDLRIPEDKYSKLVYSIEFYNGICVLNIDRNLCGGTKRIENEGVKSHQADFRYSNDRRFVQTLRNFYNWVSWDYMSKDQIALHPRIHRLMSYSFFNLSARVLIVPVRYFLYLGLKVCNYVKLRSILMSSGKEDK